MSRFLESMAERHSARMAAHEGMLRQLDIDPGADDAPFLIQELRATLLCCARCHCPTACTAWTEDGGVGQPPWCSGAASFTALAAAIAKLERRQVA